MAPIQLAKTCAVALGIALVTATPALAQNRAAMNNMPNQGWTQEAPTAVQGVEMAQINPFGLQYVSGGPGQFNWTRGMGNGGQFGLGLNANLFTGTAAMTPAAAAAAAAVAAAGIAVPAPASATTFTGGLSAQFKQQMLRGYGMAISAYGQAGLGGLGGATTTINVGAGLPITWQFGTGFFTVTPNVVLPSLTNAAGIGGNVGAGVALQIPTAPYWSTILAANPNIGFGTGAAGFSLPLAVGARLSPNATSHVDVTLGSATVTPAFALNAGLINVVGSVGFF